MGESSTTGSVTDELVSVHHNLYSVEAEEIAECMIHSSSIKALTYRPEGPFFKLQGGDQGRVEVKTDRQIG